jgi:muramoyltetrapeptide carboxypeptidase
MFERSGFLAGGDERRLAELTSALEDPGLCAVLAARGGYGLTRIAHRVAWRALLDAPKWFVGFSDVTAAHAEATRLGVASLHAHNVAGLGRGDARARSRWQEALEDPQSTRRYSGLTTWHGGVANGRLAGGNLTVLVACAAAGRLRLPDGCVLVVEDVSESSYRLDRMLTALLVAGALDRVAGVAVGDFFDCAPGRFEVPVEAVLAERLAELRVPTVAGLPIGHGRHNDPIVMGLPARLDATNGELVICPT